MEYLQTGAGRQAFGEERAEDLASPLVSADQRGDPEDEAFRACIDVKPARGIVDPVWEPIREHVEHKHGPNCLGLLGIAKQTCEKPVTQCP